jgi:hypothetical protein
MNSSGRSGMKEDVVTVRPGGRKGWIVSVDRSDGDLPFSTRQLALEFARAYARIRRAGTVQVVNDKGILEHEERVQPSAARAVR